MSLCLYSYPPQIRRETHVGFCVIFFVENQGDAYFPTCHNDMVLFTCVGPNWYWKLQKLWPWSWRLLNTFRICFVAHECVICTHLWLMVAFLVWEQGILHGRQSCLSWEPPHPSGASSPSRFFFSYTRLVPETLLKGNQACTTWTNQPYVGDWWWLCQICRFNELIKKNRPVLLLFSYVLKLMFNYWPLIFHIFIFLCHQFFRYLLEVLKGSYFHAH